MAVIKYPVILALVKGLRHTADFYYQRGRQVVLSPDDLISLIGAKTADLTAK